MAKRILIMGLPGSGKTTLAHQLQKKLSADWFNADEVRKQFNDWDFSEAGRIRQSHRMRELCNASKAEYSIVDFVCPLPEMREIFDADITVWIDTIRQGRFEDTNKLFVPPDHWDFCVTEQDAERWSTTIVSQIIRQNPLNSCGGPNATYSAATSTNTSW